MSDETPPPVGRAEHALTGQDAAQGVSYVTVDSDDDPGATRHAAPDARSGGRCVKPSGGPAPAPGGVPAPTFLDALETSSHPLPDQSRPQLAIHAPFAEARTAVWSAFTGAQIPQLHRRASKLEKCCRYPTLRTRESGELVVCPQRCRDRCCPHCAKFRAIDTGKRVLEACRRMNSVRFITLTVPHVDDYLVDQLTALRAAFGRLRRTRSWRAHVLGGVYGFEVKLSKKDGLWHPHVHVIADGSFYPFRHLLEDWRASLNHPESPWKIGPNDPLFVHVEVVHDRANVAEYVGKYVAKPTDLAEWPPSEIRQFAIAMMGQRLIHTFGTLHGATLDPADPNEDPAASTHVASLQTLNIAAGRRQRSAEIALLLFRLVFPRFAPWTRPGLDEVPDNVLRPGEGIPNALARVAAEAEREFWARIEGRRIDPTATATPQPVPPRTMPLPFPDSHAPPDRRYP